jgi:hypothetical protein
MVTARINTPGVIGKVAVRPNQRTTIADPKFAPKPNVGLVELFDTTITEVQEGEIILYDATAGKFKNAPLTDANINIDNINGGNF